VNPHPTRLRLGIATGLVCALAATPSAAQVQERPARDQLGVFGGGRAPDPPQERRRVPTTTRTISELSLTTNALGGYDAIEGTARNTSDDGLSPHTSGAMGFVESTLRFAIGRGERSFDVSGRGYLTSFARQELAGGGDLRVNAAIPFGGKNRLELSQQVRNQPQVTLGEFSHLETGIGADVIPDRDPTLTPSYQQSWSLGTAATLSRQWTTRQLTGATYGYASADYPPGFGFDSRTQSGSLDYNWQFVRSTAMTARYSLELTEFDAADVQSASTQTVDVGFDYRRRISPQRNISFSVSVGASEIDSEATATMPRQKYWTPAGDVSVGIDVGRSWLVQGTYSRSATLLTRLTPEMFVGDAFMARAGGLISRRLDATMSAGVSRGVYGGLDENQAGDPGQYRGATATAQLRWALTPRVATFVNYSYYDYIVENVPLDGTLPPDSRNHSIRVGFSLWLGGRATQPAVDSRRR